MIKSYIRPDEGFLARLEGACAAGWKVVGFYFTIHHDGTYGAEFTVMRPGRVPLNPRIGTSPTLPGIEERVLKHLITECT